jgi:hypothetical protein
VSTFADDEEVTEGDARGREQQRGRGVRIDDTPRTRMERRNDEHPSMIHEHGQAEHDRAVDRELELGEDDVRRCEGVQRDGRAEVLVLEPADRPAGERKQCERQHADRRQRNDETLTELPQVLRDRHLLAIPLGVTCWKRRRTIGEQIRGRAR